jgi:hypothetical protein
MANLRQRRLMEVQVLHADAVEKVTQLLREKLGAQAEITAFPSELMVRFAMQMDDAGLSGLLGALVPAGLVQFREVQQDLEDAFLSVTKNDAKVGGVAGAPK